MRFFSKIVTLCNIAFIIAAVSRLIQFETDTKANHNAVEPTGIIMGSIAILFLFALFFNLVFAFLVLIKRLRKQETNIHPLLILFNLILLPVEIWYHFFYK